MTPLGHYEQVKQVRAGRIVGAIMSANGQEWTCTLDNGQVVFIPADRIGANSPTAGWYTEHEGGRLIGWCSDKGFRRFFKPVGAPNPTPLDDIIQQALKHNRGLFDFACLITAEDTGAVVSNPQLKRSKIKPTKSYQSNALPKEEPKP